jgi:hypothetical protein
LFDRSEEGHGVLQEQVMELQLPSEAGVGGAEDIIFFRAAGFDVDDDNDPSPEYIIPFKGETAPDGQTWGWNGICYRKSTGLNDHPAKMNGCNHVNLKNSTFFYSSFHLNSFMRFFYCS